MMTCRVMPARQSCMEAVMVQAAQTPLRSAADPVEQLSLQLGVRMPEIEGREEHRVKRKRGYSGLT
jgi:hypothetical protein